MALIDMKRKVNRLDWQAYMVAADQQEEAGNDATAAELRRRGGIMQTLVSAVHPRRYRGGKTVVVRGPLPGGGEFRAWISERLVKLFVRTNPDQWFVQYNLTPHCFLNPDYLPRRVLEMFEQRGGNKMPVAAIPVELRHAEIRKPF